MDKNTQGMMLDIESEVKMTHYATGKNKLDDRVMRAMSEVPRQNFVDDQSRRFAFDNGPLPIGHGQTISQPFIVALMTDLLQPQPEHRILEIGTGSGYQTAILSALCQQVYSIERIQALHTLANEHLKAPEYNNIKTCVGNGYKGWPEHAPYDGIIVTAAAAGIPQALIKQLKPGGNLVIPVGLPGMHQELMLVKKDAQNKLDTHTILAVVFVPLVNDNTDQSADMQH